jgi:hypothetical protein
VYIAEWGNSGIVNSTEKIFTAKDTAQRGRNQNLTTETQRHGAQQKRPRITRMGRIDANQLRGEPCNFEEKFAVSREEFQDLQCRKRKGASTGFWSNPVDSCKESAGHKTSNGECT